MFSQRQAKCRECHRQYDKQRRLNNFEYYKNYYKNNIEYHLQRAKRQITEATLSYYIVYLLPDHNYVGITNNLIYRMYNHRSKHNRNTDNWTELARFNNRADALKCEAEYHAKGYEGAKQLSTKTSGGANTSV
jgi:predicted GIY-YIG superfamily endonuclease